MISLGNFRVLKNNIFACDYEFVLQEILLYTKQKKNLLISPIASQTLVRAYYDKNLQAVLQHFHLLLPDSQWIKRSLYILYGIHLKKRVYGPDLMLHTCRLAEKHSLKILLYGTDNHTLHALCTQLLHKFPKLKIVGAIPSKFSPLTKHELQDLAGTIAKAQAAIVFIAVGSPLQEKLTYALVQNSKKHVSSATYICIGAAFDFISRNKSQAPLWIQDAGLEWFYRLLHEPTRLWKRYLVFGTIYIFLVLKQRIFVY